MPLNFVSKDWYRLKQSKSVYVVWSKLYKLIRIQIHLTSNGLLMEATTWKGTRSPLGSLSFSTQVLFSIFWLFLIIVFCKSAIFTVISSLANQALNLSMFSLADHTGSLFREEVHYTNTVLTCLTLFHMGGLLCPPPPTEQFNVAVRRRPKEAETHWIFLKINALPDNEIFN